MRLLTVVVLLSALLLAAVLVRSAQAQELQSGYLLQGPVDDWYAVATPAGRWKAQLAEGCSIPADSDVEVSGPVDLPAAIMAADGTSCALANVSKVSDLPCFTAYGLCEVRLELVEAQ
jgi:hypothetical protein